MLVVCGILSMTLAHVTLVAPRILMWLLNVWEIYRPTFFFTVCGTSRLLSHNILIRTYGTFFLLW